MELAKIEKLLEKYEEAKTSLQEERLLKAYFAQEKVPSHLEAYKMLFNYFSDSSLDSTSKTIKLPKEKTSYKWYAIAAAIVLFISVFSLYQNNRYEQRQAELAFQETQKALELIAINLNKGNDAIAQLDRLETTQNKIFK